MHRRDRKIATKQPRRFQRRPLIAEPLEMRRVLAASLGWDGPGLGSADLTYTVANAPSSLSQAEVNAAIETAFDAWASVVDVSFTKVNQTGLRDSIDISFANIDGAGGTLAQAYFPDDVNPARIAGDIQFDISETWEVGNSLGNRAFDLVWVAAHEIGHSLGLDHLSNVGSILQAFVSPNQQFTALDAADISAIEDLYAVAGGSVSIDVPADETPSEVPVDSDTTTPDPNASDPTTPNDTDPNDPGDSDNDPFPRTRWRRGGNWHRFGGRLEAAVPENHNLYNPTDTNNDGATSALDALVIINELGRSAGSATGLCDVNGDGAVTALDALVVINSLGQTTTITIGALTIVDPTIETTDPVVDETPTDPVVDETPTDPVVDETPTDPGVDETPTDPVVDETPTDPVDEGGQTDETDTGTETDGGDDCNHDVNDQGILCRGHHGFDHHGRFGHEQIGHELLNLDGGTEQLFSRFDANADGSLTSDEVPTFVWNLLVAKGIDADSDASISLAEAEIYAANLRAERFAAKDDNGDGLLTVDEVSDHLWDKIMEADTDEDGGVSLTEFETWLTQRASGDPDTVANTAAETSGTMSIARGIDHVFSQLGRRVGHHRH